MKLKKDQKNALEDLSALNQKIEVREKLIETIHLEVKLLSGEIVANEKQNSGNSIHGYLP